MKKVTDQWASIEHHFELLHGLRAAEQQEKLAAIEDPEVRQEVASLLEHAGMTSTLHGVIDAMAAQAARSEDALPHRFGSYRVAGVIGHGGMGAVYKGIRDDNVFDRQVAIKVLQLDTPASRERFRQERQILASLEHPNIAQLLDAGESETGPSYIVLEFVDGENIIAHCESHKLDQEQRLRLFLQVCAAVQFAHQHLVVHRDLKPFNIFVTKEGVPKLLDFGIAKLLDPTGDRTLTNFYALTPKYASPEQVRGGAITTATDVYSLGIVLYEMLTGRMPYDIPSMTPADIDKVVCEAPPVPPAISPDLDNIILMALRKEPSRRYRSVEQFMQDIERSLAYQPVLARGDTLWYRAERFVRRNRLPIGASALLAAVLAGGIATTLSQARRAERRFGQVRALANVLLFDLDAQIRDVPGTTKARETLVRTALTYLDSLAAEAGGDPGLQRELGTAYAKVAAVQGQPGVPNLGKSKEALVSYRKALGVLQDAARSHPAGDLTERIAETLLDMSNVKLATGDTVGAREDLEKARVTLQGADPGSVEALRLRTLTDRRLGNIYSNLGRVQEGVAMARESVAAATELVARHPVAASYQVLGDVQGALSSAHRGAGDLPSALADTGAAIAALRQADRLEPGLSSVREALFWAYENQGTVAGNPTTANFGDAKAALESYRQGLELAETAVAADPHDRNAQRRLGAACLNIADTFSVTDPEQAIRYYDRMIGVMERISQEDPNNLTAQRMRALGQTSLAEVLLKQRRAETALPYIEGALETMDRLTKADPNRVYYVRDGVNALRLSGEAQLALHRDDLARATLQSAYDRAAGLVKAYPKDNLCLGILADTLGSLGRLYETSGKFKDLGKAREYYGQQMEIWRKWPSLNTTSVYDQSRLREARMAMDRCR